jgi:hypothetical protein
MKKVAGVVVGILLIALITFRSHGQDGSQQSSDAAPPVILANIPAPQTQLEKLMQSRATVLVKGYTDIGTLQGEDGASLRVTAVDIQATSHNRRESGLAVQIVGRSGNRSVMSFVDGDEIKSLLDALDTIAKVDHSVTRLADFESSYRTRGDLEISNIRTSGGRLVTLAGTQILSPSGMVLTGSISFRVSRLDDIRQAIVAAQEALDQAKPDDNK